MRARSLLPLVATALLASACAGKVSLSSSSPTPTIVHVGFDQRNTTVDLHVGDLLVVELPGPSPTPVSGPPFIWRVTHYPPALRLRPSDAKSGRFEFVAQSTGTGTLTAVSGCSPGPLANDMAACPLVAGVAPNLEVLFSITVVVT
jgi:hypothetical protein